MECPFCKSENHDGVRFCGGCGKFIGSVPLTQVSSSGNTGGIPRTLVPGARLQGGRYVVTKILGQGGMGAALLATDIRLDSKPVVIKELVSENTDPAKLQEDVRNFKREMATLAHIEHPLVPDVTDHFQEGARYFMVQEYVEGENLEDRMEHTKQPLKERDVLVNASEILDVLHYLSQQTPPIVHRDIKPANIVIGTRDKRAHLVDFGIARAEVARNAQRQQTSALGTPGYAPPEQYQGNADPRSDIYALGATLHHLLTNRDPRNYPPFTYPPARTFNPLLSTEVERLLSQALVNDINQRYQSAAAMKQDVDDILFHRFGIAGGNAYTITSSSPITSMTLTGTVNASGPPTIASLSGQVAPTVIGTNYSPLSGQVAPTISSANVPPVAGPYVAGAMSAPPPNYISQPSLPQYPGPQVQPVQPSYTGTPVTPLPATYPGQFQQQSQPRRNGGWKTAFLLLIVLLVLVGGTYYGVSTLLTRNNNSTVTNNGTPTTSNGLGITMINNEPIGISDGSFAFDIGANRPGAAVKQQAAQRFKQNNKDFSGTMSLLSQAISLDSNDAEAQIYLENMRVLTSGSPYVTIVVGTMISGDDTLISVGRDDLQGAYVAQKEFNDGAKIRGGVKVRLLIANSGSRTEWATNVAQQIVQLSQADKTFVGIMGWPYSSRTVQAVQVLGKAHIPMVSQTASDDGLTSISPYFFRVAPSNKAQAIAGAKYAEDVLHAKTVALFYDPSDPYSQSLASGFSQQFKADGNQVLVEEKYTVKKPETLPASLQDALKANPDFIYFSGYSDDMGKLLVNLPPGTLPIMGGDALYELGGYPSSARANFSRLHFTTFAYPDEWDVLGYGSSKPAFFTEYASAFDPNKLHQGSPYGFTRPANDVILTYDAMIALLKSCDIAFSSGKQTITPEDVKQALGHLNGDNVLQGVSGQISFGPDGNPVDKAIVILYVDPDGHIKMEPTRLGRFLK